MVDAVVCGDGRRLRGSRSERLAAAYLRAKGYRIVERNYRCVLGELDLVAEDRGTLVFCEVKSRDGLFLTDPLEAVTEAKQRRIRRLAEHYLLCRGLEDVVCRFDVIGITRERNRLKMSHIVDAF